MRMLEAVQAVAIAEALGQKFKLGYLAGRGAHIATNVINIYFSELKLTFQSLDTHQRRAHA